MTVDPRTMTPAFQARCFAALRRQGYSSAELGPLYRRWEAGILADPCREEAAGKEIGLHTGCECPGCRQRVALMFLTSAAALARRDGHI